MRSTIRKPPSAYKVANINAIDESVDLHLWRSCGLGDMIFMEPALRQLKALRPDRRITLHANHKYTAIYREIGFDQFAPTNSQHRDGPGIELNRAIEAHPGIHCLDRVSMWEEIMGLKIGDAPVSIQFKTDRSSLLALPNADKDKPFLSFTPFTSCGGLGGRNLPISVVNELAKAMSEQYNVVMLTNEAQQRPGVELDAICSKTGCSMEEFITLTASCDRAIGCDSGGIWVAGAAGIPTVGIFEHVAPWLRSHRFPTVYNLYLRRRSCNCHQHGNCTQTPHLGDAPCKFISAEEVMESIHCASRLGLCTRLVPTGQHILRPSVSVSIDSPRPARETLFCIEHALSGLTWHIAPKSDKHTFHWTVENGSLPKREDVLYTLSALQMPMPHTMVPRVNIVATKPNGGLFYSR